MPKQKKPLTEGQTEAPRAISPTPPSKGPTDISKHGETEAPQAVSRPAQPSEKPSSKDKKV